MEHPKLILNEALINSVLGDSWENDFLKDEHLANVVRRIKDQDFYFDRKRGYLDGFLELEGEWFLNISGNLLDTLSTVLSVVALKGYRCFDYFTAPMDGGACVGKTVRELVGQRIDDDENDYDLSTADTIDVNQISRTAMYKKSFEVSSYAGRKSGTAIMGRDFYTLVEYINARSVRLGDKPLVENGFFNSNSHMLFIGDDINETSGTVRKIVYSAAHMVPTMPFVAYGVIVNKIDHKQKFISANDFVQIARDASSLAEVEHIGVTPDMSIFTLHPYSGKTGRDKAWVILPYEVRGIPDAILYQTDPIKAIAREILRKL